EVVEHHVLAGRATVAVVHRVRVEDPGSVRQLERDRERPAVDDLVAGHDRDVELVDEAVRQYRAGQAEDRGAGVRQTPVVQVDRLLEALRSAAELRTPAETDAQDLDRVLAGGNFEDGSEFLSRNEARTGHLPTSGPV